MNKHPATERAERYLASARMLLDHGDFESVASRCYYAMFYIARAMLEQKGIEPKTHAGIHNQFGQHFVRRGEVSQELNTAFSEAWRLREFAEYAEEAFMEHGEAAELLTDAEAFVAALTPRLATDEGDA